MKTRRMVVAPSNLLKPGRRGLLRAYLWLIVATTVVTVLTTLWLVAQRPADYTSTARVVVNSVAINGTPIAPDMGTEREIALSGNVTRRAAARLGAPADVAGEGLEVTVPVDTSVLEFAYTADDAPAAYAGASVFTDSYLDYRNSGHRAAVAQLITPAAEPSEPDPSNLPLAAGLSVLLGAMLGLGAAFAWDRLTDRLRSVDDIQAHTGLPVLASVPQLPIAQDPATAGSPAGPGAEVYGYLAAQLLHGMATRKAVTVLVTSPSPEAGRTTTAVNLSRALASVGKNVVLVSGDLRRPSAHHWFGLSEQPGLTEVLSGTCSLERALHPTSVESLRVLTSGAAPTGGAPTFNLDDLGLLLERLSTEADAVVIDSGPVLGAAETVLLADRVDLVLLVVDGRRGLRADAHAAVSALSHVGDRLFGSVVNVPRRAGRVRRSLSAPSRAVTTPTPASTTSPGQQDQDADAQV